MSARLLVLLQHSIPCLPSAISHLLSAICHQPSAIRQTCPATCPPMPNGIIGVGRRGGGQASANLLIERNKFLYRPVVSSFYFEWEEAAGKFPISSVVGHTLAAFTFSAAGFVCAGTTLFILLKRAFHSILHGSVNS